MSLILMVQNHRRFKMHFTQSAQSKMHTKKHKEIGIYLTASAQSEIPRKGKPKTNVFVSFNVFVMPLNTFIS